MKYLKRFEYGNDVYIKKSIDGKYFFKTGDVVKCVNTAAAIALKLNDIYTIENWTDLTDDYEVKVDGKWYNSRRFVLATPEDIERYEITKNKDKYNL